MARHLVFLCVCLWCPLPLLAQGASLFAPNAVGQPLFAGADSLAAIRASVPAQGRERAPGSLFDGPARGFFAPLPETFRGPVSAQWRGPVARLRDLIARAEAGAAGYDAVQHGARIRPPKPPTRMTLAEIRAWIAATPGQPHAIGRYQIIPATLEALIAQEGLQDTARFDAALQDRLADALMRGAGLKAFLAGDMPPDTFMDRLAQVWAGLPTANGRSYYDGYAGNAATITRGEYEAAFARIFPPA